VEYFPYPDLLLYTMEDRVGTGTSETTLLLKEFCERIPLGDEFVVVESCDSTDVKS
jgi:hypothetical protein